jgi:hypothetical protein
MAQRAQRAGPRRAPGRNDRGDEDAGQHDRERPRERQRVGGTDAEQHAVQQPAEHERDGETQRGADRAEPQAALQEFADDARGRCAERDADTDLARTLLRRVVRPREGWTPSIRNDRN